MEAMQSVEQASSRAIAREYLGSASPHVAMPLGGVGAGHIAIGADGGLRQWQIHNQINHTGFVPHSFFAIRATSTEPPINVLRLLQLAPGDDPRGSTPLVNDDMIPPDQRALFDVASGVQETHFSAVYPFARIGYEDAALPVEVSLETYTPFVPLDADASGFPAIRFTFTLRNRIPHQVNGALAGTLQNAVGWDGITPIDGVANPLYGGNTNHVRREPGRVSIVMENPALSDDHPGAGQMVLAALDGDGRTFPRWTDPAQFIRFLEGFNQGSRIGGKAWEHERDHRNTPGNAFGPSPNGTTWNGGIAIPFRLAPGESTRVTFVIAWHFPNRYVNFDQFGPYRDYGRSKFWLGNAYATRFVDAVDTVSALIDREAELEFLSRRWENVIRDTTFPDWLVETLAAQGSLIRSPTTFWTEDGKFFGFEGALGESTGMWNGTFGGSCPLNCTHVWNYELALSRLFPSLERTMRETDLEHAQAPEGYIPHRTIAPLYLKQLWDEPVNGPTNPALDGMLGEVLKVYREARHCGDRAWFDRMWPRVAKLLRYIIAKWDDDNDGVLQGEQPNTYDIAFYGPNMYIGALWLAALRAGEEMAKTQGDSDVAVTLRDRFERGGAEYDRLLWNGEYYIQLIDEQAPPEDQFGTGCLADQLFGQWWAHLLDLGYVLPEAHVKTTLRSIAQYNTKVGFRGFEHGYRVFADQDDSGLLVCTWPQGGRPEIPVRYCDEVWTGIEYQVAATAIASGQIASGLEIARNLRNRYDGTRRNPYNEIECGDHYSRAMAGWSLLDALTGVRYDGLTQTLSINPPDGQGDFRAPIIFGSGWGTIDWQPSGPERSISLFCSYGEFTFNELHLAVDGASSLSIDGVPAAASIEGNVIRFTEPVRVAEGSRLVIGF